MRKASGAVVAMILAIAFYFTVFWGFDALRILTSPTYGLEDVWRSQTVFGLGRIFGFGPEGLLRLAAVLGAVKLTVAIVCAIHLLDRLRSFFGGTANSEVLEGGLMLVVIATMLAAVPALRAGNHELLREHVFQLLLAGIGAALCIMERINLARAERSATTATIVPVAAVESRAAFAPWR